MPKKHIPKLNIPGDSIRDLFFVLFGGKDHLTIPKRSLAELPENDMFIIANVAKFIAVADVC